MIKMIKMMKMKKEAKKTMVNELNDYIIKNGQYPVKAIVRYYPILLPDAYVEHMLLNQNRKQVVEFMAEYEKLSGTTFAMACGFDFNFFRVPEYMDFFIERIKYYKGKKSYETEYFERTGISKEEAILYGFDEECIQFSIYEKFFSDFVSKGKRTVGKAVYGVCMEKIIKQDVVVVA